FARSVSGSQQQQLQDDEHIAALNSFLGMASSPGTSGSVRSQQRRQQQQQQQQQQQPQQTMASANDQAMAAFLASTAATYSGIPAVGVPSQHSPMMTSTIGITPSQSIQSLQLNDFGSDATSLAVLAASQTQPGVLTTTTTVDMANPVYSNNSLTSIDSASFSSMLSAPAQQAVFETSAAPGSYSMAQVPATIPSNSGFLTPTAVSYDQAAAAAAAVAQANIDLLLGKRKFDDTEMGFLTPSIGGVPLSKRVSMPVSYGDFQSQAAAAAATMMPVPADISMQRISSYHPGVYVNASPAQSSDIGSSSGTLQMAPVKLPISRLKTTPAGSVAAKSNGASKRMLGSSATFSALPQPQPTQHQRKVAHNAIERRYRNNINDRICDLRNSVPALQHIRPKKKPHTMSSYARDNGDSSNDEDDDDDDNDIEGGSNQVDGVEAATKLNKATILGKSTEYIYHLRRTNDLLRRESTYLQDIIRSLPDGQKIIDRVLQRAKDESAIATVMLKVPERATMPKKKSQQKQ
ncbi:hypothetical protein LPJ57_003272, partial [Coemansia sp. RSA 486]